MLTSDVNPFMLKWNILSLFYAHLKKSLNKLFSNMFIITSETILCSKTCLKTVTNNKTKILMTNDSLMKVETIAECSP